MQCKHVQNLATLALISASLLALCRPEDEPDSDTFLACLPRPPLAVAVVAAEVDEELPNQERGMVVSSQQVTAYYGMAILLPMMALQ